jgi:hypothetical protein
MKKLLQIAGCALIVAASFLLVTGLGPKTCPAGQRWTQIPGGAVPQNTRSVSPGFNTYLQPIGEYGWQVSGPFTASVLSYTATIIKPSSLCTNCLGYQGPFRIVFTTGQQIQYQPTSLTYGPGVTWTASTLGLIAANAAIVDTQASFGECWPGGSFAFQLSPTATAVSNNLTYWILDQGW